MTFKRSWAQYMTPRRFGLFLCLVGFVWGLMLVNMTITGVNSGKDSDRLKEEIVQLSEKYVKALARENENAVDGPYVGRFTGYDLKKTLAVLLENMLERLSNLEAKVDLALKNRTLSGLSDTGLSSLLQQIKSAKASAIQTTKKDEGKPIDARALLTGQMEKCELTPGEKRQYPHCKGKMDWMRAHWKSDPCYAANGVDGTECSFRLYLSETEQWCPLLPGRSQHIANETVVSENAKMRFDVEGLLTKLKDPGRRKNYAWIRLRITRLWSKWVASAHKLAAKQNMNNRPRKKVLVHLGLLTTQSGFKIAEDAFKGGPLGELVQWSDIITSLYILGHDLVITSEVEQLQMILSKFPSAGAQCQDRAKLPIDMIYTDIIGLRQFKRKVAKGYGKFSCLLRIVDSFGTEPSFNYEAYAKSHGMKTTWGMQNLNPQQFYTMFPHSPDNSFMGFTVPSHVNESHGRQIPRRDQALVYGKATYMWAGKENYLNIIRKNTEIHGTVFIDRANKYPIPAFVKNHGILSGTELHSLLRQSKLFVGLGFPYEGPAPLEAIAQGCVFLNPRFDPPHSSRNTRFFKGKPTLRRVTSQHPYAEVFIGEPHVFTINMNDAKQVADAVRRALQALNSTKVQPYLPYEFTEEGMMQRLNAYIMHQQFCDTKPKLWPPVEAVDIILAEKGVSCKDACMSHNLICEPSHFRRINTKEELSNHISGCGGVDHVEDLIFPAVDPNTRQCYLQKQPMLFSCVGEVPHLSRLCPCRNFVKGQTALCKQCL